LLTEKDLEEICKNEIQNEIEKITVQCNVCGTECCMETDSAEAILYVIGIEKQAEKMLQVK